MKTVSALVVVALMVTMLPQPVQAQSKIWTAHMSGDLGIGTIRRGSSGGDLSLDVAAGLSLTSYPVRPVFSAALISQAVGCTLIGPCLSGQSTWIGGGVTYTVSQRSFAQPFIGGEIGSFRYRSGPGEFAWQATVGLALVKNDFAVRLVGRFRKLPSLDVRQLHGAIGVGLRL